MPYTYGTFKISHYYAILRIVTHSLLNAEKLLSLSLDVNGSVPRIRIAFFIFSKLGKATAFIVDKIVSGT